MSVLAYVVMGLGYGLVAAAQPGPFQAYLIAQTLAHGWRRTLPAITGPLLTDGPIIAVVLLFLTHIPDTFRTLLHLLSGGFILYLAWAAYRQWRGLVAGGSTTNDPAAGAGTTPHKGRRSSATQQSVFQAALMNLLGPGPYLFWSLVAGPALMQAWAASPQHAIGFLLGFYAAMLTCLAGIVLAFGSAQRLGPRVSRGLLGLSIIALAGFGVAQLWQGVTRLVVLT